VSKTEGSKSTNKSEVKPQANKRVVFTMGGKGGVGKTGCMLALVEWFEANQIPFTLLDLDTENKSRGSLKHYFNGAAQKVNIHTAAGLDAFIDYLSDGAPVVLADMGAGSGQVAHEWFDTMYEDVAEQGIAFTAVGIVTSDPASVESVLELGKPSPGSRGLPDCRECAFAANRPDVLERQRTGTPFPRDFQATGDHDGAPPARPRKPDPATRRDVGQVAERKTQIEELQKASIVMRAQAYRRRLFAEFEKAKEALLP
jgi:hypothetical protein